MPPGSASVSDSSVPPCQLIAIIAALGISHCSAPLRLLDSLLGFPTSSWSLDLSYMFGSLFDARCPCSHSAYSQLPGALVVTRPTASCCAQSWLLGALLVYRRLPVCSILSPLGALNFNRGHSSPSWLLCRALLGNMQQAHSSMFGTLLAFQRNLCRWLPAWPLCALMAARRSTGLLGVLIAHWPVPFKPLTALRLLYAHLLLSRPGRCRAMGKVPGSREDTE